VEGLKACLAKQEHADIAERERHRIAEFEWDEERVQLISRRTLEAFREELAVELAAAQEQLVQKDYEYGVLKGELEAQWKHTELASEQTGEMRKEMDGIREEAEALEKRIGEMAVEWNESESQRAQMENELQEMLSVKTTLESEKYEVGIRICILIISFTDGFIYSSRNNFAKNANVMVTLHRLRRIMKGTLRVSPPKANSRPIASHVSRKISSKEMQKLPIILNGSLNTRL
jgi:DNA repair exonuclease SbcCD ATPase subunit